MLGRGIEPPRPGPRVQDPDHAGKSRRSGEVRGSAAAHATVRRIETVPRFGARRPFRPPNRRPNRPPGAVEERRAPTAVQRRPENVDVEIPSRLTVKELA